MTLEFDISRVGRGIAAATPRAAYGAILLLAGLGCASPDVVDDAAAAGETGDAAVPGSPGGVAVPVGAGAAAGVVADPPSGAKASPAVQLADLDGAPVSLHDLRGDVAIVNFWGTWCLPCRTELPELAELAEAYAERGVRVIGIAVDSGTPEEIRAFARDYGVDYELWITTMDTALSEFGAIGYPFTLLIDREGWIRAEYLGPQTRASLAEDIDPLLE